MFQVYFRLQKGKAKCENFCFEYLHICMKAECPGPWEYFPFKTDPLHESFVYLGRTWQYKLFDFPHTNNFLQEFGKCS